MQLVRVTNQSHIYFTITIYRLTAHLPDCKIVATYKTDPMAMGMAYISCKFIMITMISIKRDAQQQNYSKIV